MLPRGALEAAQHLERVGADAHHLRAGHRLQRREHALVVHRCAALGPVRARGRGGRLRPDPQHQNHPDQRGQRHALQESARRPSGGPCAPASPGTGATPSSRTSYATFGTGSRTPLVAAAAWPAQQRAHPVLPQTPPRAGLRSRIHGGLRLGALPHRLRLRPRRVQDRRHQLRRHRLFELGAVGRADGGALLHQRLQALAQARLLLQRLLDALVVGLVLELTVQIGQQRHGVDRHLLPSF